MKAETPIADPTQRGIWIGWFAVILTWITGSVVACSLSETRRQLQEAAEHQIGAKLGSPYVNAGGQFEEVLAFEQVVPGGAAANAGIRNGDFFAPGESIARFLKAVNAPESNVAAVRIVPGGEGAVITERAERLVVLQLP